MAVNYKLLEVSQQELDIITQFIEDKKEQIIKNQKDRGIRAFGKSAEMLHSKLDQRQDHYVRMQLIDGAGTFQSQEEGMKPGTNTKIDDLYKWLELKKYGLNWKSDKQRRFIAIRIALKHRREGSYTYRHGPTHVLSDSINKDRVQRLTDALAKYNGAEALSDLKNFYENNQ